MRKNKKRSKKLSVIALNSMRFGVVIVMAAVMSIVGMLAKSSCDQLMKTIGRMETELNSLEKTRQRESTQWEKMATPERLEQVLLQQGMGMRLARHDQVIHMDSNGRLIPGQHSVAVVKRRHGLSAAQYHVGQDEELPPAVSGKRAKNGKKR